MKTQEEMLEALRSASAVTIDGERWVREISRNQMARIIREAYETELASINGDSTFEYRAADALLAFSPAEREDTQ